MTRRALLSALLCTGLLAGAAPAFAQEADAFVYDLSVPQGLTRAEVRAELEAARLAGVLPQPGEAGDSDAMLVARAEYERLAAQVRMAQRADEAQSPAMRAAVVAMAQAMGEDDLLVLEFLGLLEDDPVLLGMAVEVDDVGRGPAPPTPPGDGPAAPAALHERRD
jgi:Domain of unknown function (DUF4148)